MVGWKSVVSEFEGDIMFFGGDQKGFVHFVHWEFWFFLFDGMKCLFSSKKCKSTLSEKVMLLKLNLELSTGWQIVVQFSVREWLL